jgi:hypothetical protein
MFDCALEDLAYLLGLICGRGSLDYNAKKINIKFPFRLRQIHSSGGDTNQRDRMIIDLDSIVNRLADFTGKAVRKEDNDTNVVLSIPFSSETHTWQIISRFYNSEVDFHHFNLPSEIYYTPFQFKENFIKGVGDTAGFITEGNADQQHRHRVYIEIPNVNWILPIQLCSLLQDGLDIPVNTITWGHPNIRGKGNWKKEHQIKVYAEYYEKIGFTVQYKQRILEEYASENRNNSKNLALKYCNPKNKKIRSIKDPSPDESSQDLPNILKGSHYNSFWEICYRLGCNKCIQR